MSKTPLRLLLVDKNDQDAEMIYGLLAEQNKTLFHLERSYTLSDAKRDKDFNDYDVILFDFHRSDLQNLSTIKAMLSETHRAVVVFASDPHVTMTLKAIRSGVQDFLQKPDLTTAILLQSLTFAIERQKEHDRLYSLAYRDEITGLPNRNAFMEQFSNVQDLPATKDAKIGIHIIRMANLKSTIMEHGLPTGEAYMKAIATRIYGFFQTGQFFARLEGEDFALLQSSVEHDGHMAYVTRRIHEQLPQELNFHGHEIDVSLCIGHAIAPDHGGSIEELFAHAFSDIEAHMIKDESAQQAVLG